MSIEGMSIAEWMTGGWYIRNFPRFVNITNEQDQIAKIREEVIEVTMADNKEDKIMEILDVIHACETLLDVIGAKDPEIKRAYLKVVEKNYERGYYDEVEEDYAAGEHKDSQPAARVQMED